MIINHSRRSRRWYFIFSSGVNVFHCSWYRARMKSVLSSKGSIDARPLILPPSAASRMKDGDMSVVASDSSFAVMGRRMKKGGTSLRSWTGRSQGSTDMAGAAVRVLPPLGRTVSLGSFKSRRFLGSVPCRPDQMTEKRSIYSICFNNN